MIILFLRSFSSIETIEQTRETVLTFPGTLFSVFEIVMNICIVFDMKLLKCINNSSSLNKENHNREGGLDTRS